MTKWLRAIFAFFLFEFSTKRNVLLVFWTIYFKLLMQWRRIRYFFSRKFGAPFCRNVLSKNVPQDRLSVFLSAVGKWHDTFWQERKKFMNPYIAFEEHFVGNVFGMGEVEVRYTGSFRVGFQTLGMSFGSDNDIMYIYKAIRPSGPASTILRNKAILPNVVNFGQLDNVFALHCPCWPEDAKDWLCRERKNGFPSPDVAKAVLEYGVDLVPKSKLISGNHSKKNQSSKFLWRISFSVAELLLVNTWSEAQRICYRYSKTFLTCDLRHLGISTYAGLNLMLWLIEETRSDLWIDRNLVLCVKMFFERLEKCCFRGFCPHYFVPTNNVFAGIPMGKLLEGARICQGIQRDFYAHLWLNEGIWRYIKGARESYWIAPNLTSVFYGISDDGIFTSFLKRWSVSLSDLQKSCAEAYKIYYCLKIYKDIARCWYSPNAGYPLRMERILKAVASFLRGSITCTNKETEYMLNCVRFAHLCFLETYFREAVDSEWHFFHRNEMTQLRNYLSSQEELQDDVVQALERYKDGDFEAAIRLLEKDSLEIQDSAQRFPVFSRFDKNCADPIIKFFPFKGHAYYCPKIIVSWYVLWKSYVALGMDTEDKIATAKEKLKELDLTVLYKGHLTLLKPLFELFGERLQKIAFSS
ncbi:hypothetical protein OS493_007421 [Desmophyllum pertusum]|uniref:Mab-21-like HhH/H2TH-like domain-containing protein n=1 Tax=Desmophyllum pertusum TaxID=174260 RepID=A0A9W9Z5T7_9CNID|nr:hypothetical protein OS493_007421 [Desmophyllum pertusum]